MHQVNSPLDLSTGKETYHCDLNSLVRCAAHAQTSGAAQSVWGVVVEDEPLWLDETSRIKKAFCNQFDTLQVSLVL